MKKLGLLFTIVIMAVLFAVSASALEPTGQCGDNVYWSFDETTGELVISGEGDMWDYTLGRSPFSKNIDIVSVTIEEGITSIGKGSFASCGLRNIYIPDSITTIGDYAFAYSEYLESVEIPYGVTKINEGIFMWCLHLASVNIPDNVTSIGNCAFLACPSLRTINIPDSVTSIGDSAFYSCFGITEITIPESVKTIEKNAFSEMNFLDKIYIKSMDTYLGPDLSLSLESMGFSGITYEEFYFLWKRIENGDAEAITELQKYVVYYEEETWFGTFYCHPGSTTEAYAIENGAKYVLTHFFEGEWTYDYENGIKYRKCIHCDELEKHILTATVTEPTCATQGYTTYICECGETFTRDYTSATNHIDNNSDYLCDYGCGYEFEKPADPTPDEPANQTFIQKIISWFKNLFDKLFGWLKR